MQRYAYLRRRLRFDASFLVRVPVGRPRSLLRALLAEILQRKPCHLGHMGTAMALRCGAICSGCFGKFACLNRFRLCTLNILSPNSFSNNHFGLHFMTQSCPAKKQKIRSLFFRVSWPFILREPICMVDVRSLGWFRHPGFHPGRGLSRCSKASLGICQFGV